MAQRLSVMISSTALDLPDHRKEAMDACLRQGMFPYMMEHLPAKDTDAKQVSMELVDKADIYLGIFAHRYGYVPAGHDISITEMEYNYAFKERKIPCLIFLMHEDHPLKKADVETGEGAAKLEALKKRLGTERVINFFKSPEDLRAHVINSLSPYHERDLTAFHYVSDIPAPPEPYIAHPYTLLRSSLVGRQIELNLLTEWVSNPNADVYQARILNIVAIGGMGKSALTWKWFNDIAPQAMKPLAGRMWWSFYESDARFENFIIRALAYVTKQAKEEILKIPPPEREENLLAVLDREPFLLVLDGLERILIAYARMDAARLSDDDLDDRTANVVAGARDLPESAAQSFTGQHQLRKVTDPRAGAFLRKLASVRAARVLVSTRLYPRDLQDRLTDDTIRGSFAYFLRELNDDDALNLWRKFEVGGSREDLLRLFHTFDKHPLLIKALAGEVKRYRRAPGDFDRWWQDHQDFDPFRLSAVQEARSHVLEFALRGLDKATSKVLHTIAAFRMPATYNTLTALLVGKGRGKRKSKLFADEALLVTALTELEDRGLLGWDKRANRYDLHPIVRGVIWSGLDDDARRGIYGTMHAHFESIPAFEDREQISSLEDLTPAIELYNTLIGLGRYDDAYTVFNDRLNDFTLRRLSASRQRAEWLELLFTKGTDQLPQLSQIKWQGSTLQALALAYDHSGQPGRAVPLYRRSNELAEQQGDIQILSIHLSNLSNALRLCGALRGSEATALQAMSIIREHPNDFAGACNARVLGMALAARGVTGNAEVIVQRAWHIFATMHAEQGEGICHADLAQLALWLDKYTAAQRLANRAWELARSEHDFIRAKRLQGAAALGLDDFVTANEYLHHALTRARAANLVEEELQTMVGLAELQRRQGAFNAAREMLEDLWEPVECGPYPLFHADAYNVMSQIERDAGNHAAAIEAATKAYRLAWCDGPPFAYHWGLKAARAHLAALGVPEPNDLPPFDESKHEPMVEVEINPPNEFEEHKNRFR